MVRIYNRRKGNAGIHCQMVTCLEVPVCEEYTNAKKSVGNPLYPTMPAFQYLMNDNCHALMFEGWMNDDDMRIENEKAMYIYVRDKCEKDIKKLIAKMLDWKLVHDAP